MAEKVAVAPKVKQQPAHVGYSCVHPEQESDGIHNGRKHPQPEEVKNAQHNPASRKSALNDRLKSTYQK